METSRFFILISWKSVLCCRGHHTMWVNPHGWKEPQQHLPVPCIRLRAERGPGLLPLLAMLAHLPGGLRHRWANFPNSENLVLLVWSEAGQALPGAPGHFSLKLYPLPSPAMQLPAELHCWVRWTFLDLNLEGTVFSLSVSQAASMFYSLTILLFFSSLKF